MRIVLVCLTFVLALSRSNATQVTVQTNPTGRSFMVDGTTYTSTQTFAWAAGSQHTLSTTAIQNLDSTTRFVWTHWSDGGGISRTITTPSTAASYIANFGTQYYLSMSTTNFNLSYVQPASDWYGKDTTIGIITGQAGAAVYFNGWVGTGPGSYSGLSQSANIVLSGPIAEVAQWDVCSVMINPTGISLDYTGGSGSFVVNSPVLQCSSQWIFFDSNPDWLHASRQDDGIAYNVDSNADTISRIANIVIILGHVPEQTFQIKQSSSSSTRWELPLTINDVCGDTAVVRIGQKATATNGIDRSLGEMELPPVPPTGSFDARLILPVVPPAASFIDFRRDTLSFVTWRIGFQAGACGCPMTFKWKPGLIPANDEAYLKDEASGTVVNVDMKQDSSFSLTNGAITSLKIEYHRRVRKDVVLARGWNLVSIPLMTASMAKSDLFPTVTAPSYSYVNGYVVSETLNTSKGYWVQSSEASSSTVSILGFRDTVTQIAVGAGWTMVGPLHFDIATNVIGTTPPGILQTPFYGYNHGYITVDTLKAGRGYWIKASRAGTLQIGAGPAKLSAPTYAMNGSWMRMEVTDKNGVQSNVFFAPEREYSTPYALPPYGPSEITDIRFSNNTLVENAAKKRYDVTIQSTAFPLHVRGYNMSGRVLNVQDNINGHILNTALSEGSDVIIAQNLPAITLTELVPAQQGNAPTVFALNQNYPNPFNPATTIGYDVPEPSWVSLTIYDVLGAKVAGLVNEVKSTGRFTTTWNANNVASGVYFARFTSSDVNGTVKFSKVNKLLLMK